MALTTEQYKAIIETMKNGWDGGNECIVTALVLGGNQGLRMSDILSGFVISFGMRTTVS